MNPMRSIKIQKVTINVGCGEAGEKLDKAKKLLEKLTGSKVVLTKTKRRTTFGTPRNRPIGVKVTLRKEKAIEFLKKALEAVEMKIRFSSFDKDGNFSFGIKEHIDLPGVRYDPNIGIYGMDVCVTLERKGFRVLRRRISNKISKKHKIVPEESAEWLNKNFNVEILR